MVAAIFITAGIVAGVLLIRDIALPSPPWRELFPYGELRVGVDPSRPPFAAFGDNGLYGLEIDLAYQLAIRLDLPLRFVPLGYDGLYDALKTDQVDALIAGLTIDLTRLSDIHYSPPYFNAGLILVNESDITRMEDLPGRKLAYEFGSEADSEARAWLRRIIAFETRPYERPTQALDATRLGEADASLVDSISALLYLKEHPDWQANLYEVTDNLYAIATQSRHPETSDAVREALQLLIEDGTLTTLIDRWL